MTWALPTVSGMTPQVSGVASLSSRQILAGARLLSHRSTAIRPAAQRCLTVRTLASRGYSDQGYGNSQGFHSSAAYRQVSTSASASVSCCCKHLVSCLSFTKWLFDCQMLVPCRQSLMLLGFHCVVVCGCEPVHTPFYFAFPQLPDVQLTDHCSLCVGC